MFDVDIDGGRIRAYGEVGWIEDGFGQEDFLRAFDDMGGRDVEIHLDSKGGDIQSGISIYNQIDDYRGNVRVVIDAMAASIASVIPLSAGEILAHKNSRLMTHNPWSIVMGDAREFRHTADILDALGRDMAELYAERSGQNVDFWLEKMDEITYFSATEALDVGLIDGIVDKCKPKRRSEAARDMSRPKAAALQATIARVKKISESLTTT